MDATCIPAGVNHLDVNQLAAVIKNRIDKVLIIDSRSFLEFNTCHIVSSVNVCCSKIVKRRLQQGKVTVKDFLIHTCQIEADESLDIVVYDQGSAEVSSLAVDSFIFVLLSKLSEVFKSLSLLKGGFLEFQSSYPALCEDKTRKCAPMTSLSQPCMPISNMGPTKILPFLFLGSQNDAMNKDLLKNHNITYELNVSTNCPQPEFLQDHHFMRIPVNDNYSEKLLPYFPKAFQFLDKARESNACVLVHCLAGISRSPTVAIAYVMRHLHMTSDEAYRYVKSKRATISPNFNFLGQLLEYERQLEQENLLHQQQQQSGECLTGGVGIGRFVFDASPPFVNGYKRQCCTDMRSGLTTSRSLTLKLPLDPGFSAQLAFSAVSSVNSGGDLSPTSGIAKLSFSCRSDTTTTTSSCSSSLIQDSTTAKFKCLKSKLQYLTSLKEESAIRSSSSPDSGSPVSPSPPSPPPTDAAAGAVPPLKSSTPTRPTSLSPVISLVSPCFPSHDFLTGSHKKEAATVVEDGVAGRLGEKRRCEGGAPLAEYPDWVESLTSSMCTTASGSSMSSSWDYSRSDSTSGIGSEASMVESVESQPGRDWESAVGSHCMVVDNESVLLRKPFSPCPTRRGPPALSCGKADHLVDSQFNRDSGNPLSPSDPTGDSGATSVTGRSDTSGDICPFGFEVRDSGIMSPTWSVQSVSEYAAKFGDGDQGSPSSPYPLTTPTVAGYSNPDTNLVKKSDIRYVPVSTTTNNTISERSRCYSTSAWKDAACTNKLSSGMSQRRMFTSETSKTTGSFVSSIDTSVLGHLHHRPHHQGAVKSVATTAATYSSTLVNVPRDRLTTMTYHSKCPHGGSTVVRKEDGLYRAQSCPGILGRFQCPTSPDGAGLAAAFLTSSPSSGILPPLRRPNPSSPSARTGDKFRNRYSCGSLDYSDLERIVFDSCPDFAHLGRCQSSGAISAGVERSGAPTSPLTPTHRTFGGRNVSIIQVS